MFLNVEEIKKYHESGELEKVVGIAGFDLEDVVTCLLIELESKDNVITDLERQLAMWKY